MKIALLNLSSAHPAEMQYIATALDIYLDHVCEAWERAAVHVEFMQGKQVAPDGWTPLVAFDDPDSPGVQGYHDVDEKGRAYGRAFLNMVPGKRVLRDPDGGGASLAGVLSHEAAEMALDILANAYQDGPFVDPVSGKRYTQVAVELCDPVQEQAYAVQVGDMMVDASNFIFPAWFNRRAGTGEQLDKMGNLVLPLTLAPGGYVIVRDTGTDAQVFARLFGRARKQTVRLDKVYHHRPPALWREKMKLAHGGRTSRRLAFK